MKEKGYVNWLFTSVFSSLEIRVTQTSIKQQINALTTFDLEVISDCFKHYAIRSMGVNIGTQDLGQIPLPAIIALNTPSLSFGILTKVDNHRVEFKTYQNGLESKTIDDFGCEWTGIALLLEKTNRSGEPNFVNNRRLEKLSGLRRSLAYGLALLLFIAGGFAVPGFILPFLFLSAGLALGLALFKQALGQETILGQAICKSGTATDCNKVIKSKLAIVYADISLAEITFLFFAGVLSAQVVSLVFNLSYNVFLCWLSVTALPVTALSIYYQWRVLRTWCLLCLGVVACLWGLAGFYAYHIDDWSGGWLATQAFAIGVALPLLLWFVVRTPIIQAASLPAFEKALSKFTKRLSVFEALSAQKAEIQLESYVGDVVLGNPEATQSITIVTNPTCGPCARAHRLADNWLEEHGDRLRIVLRFAVNPTDSGTSRTVAKRLLTLGLRGDERLSIAVHDWYAREKPDLHEWLDRFNTAEHPEAEVRLTEHVQWCLANQLNATPTILFDSQQIPEEFSLHDFEYFLRLKMAEVEMAGAEA